MKPEDLVYEKHNFNSYGTIIFFTSNFLTEVTDTDEVYKMLNEFNDEINELKSEVGQDEEIDDVIKNASLVYNNQLKFFDDSILKNKQIFNPRLSSSPLSTRFLSQETVAERVKLRP